MAHLRIHPLGAIDIDTFENGGDTFVLTRLADPRSGDSVEIVFAVPAFVTLADYLRMVADDLVGEQKPPL